MAPLTAFHVSFGLPVEELPAVTEGAAGAAVLALPLTILLCPLVPTLFTALTR